MNKERLVWGDREATYLNMIAEIVVRIFEQKYSEGSTGIHIDLIPGSFKLAEENVERTIKNGEYERRIREGVSFFLTRRGVAAQSQDWKLGNVQIEHAQQKPELIVCDLLSNLSFRDYRNLTDAGGLRDTLKHRLGKYDFTFQYDFTVERVSRLRHLGAYGYSLQTAIEFLNVPHVNTKTREALKEEIGIVLNQLATIPARMRDSHLEILITLLHTEIDQKRKLKEGLALVGQLGKSIDDPLRQILSEDQQSSLDWFSYQIAYWGLMASNHLNLLKDGDDFVRKLDELEPDVIRRWEAGYHNGTSRVARVPAETTSRRSVTTGFLPSFAQGNHGRHQRRT